MQLGREVWEVYEIEDILSDGALDCWYYGILSVYENYMTNTIVFYQYAPVNLYIPTRSGTGKVIKIVKRDL